MNYKLYYWDYIQVQEYFKRKPKLHNDKDWKTLYGTKLYVIIGSELAMLITLKYPDIKPVPITSK